MNGIFKFHNIGQGLFYSGTITNNDTQFDFIFDCGTISDNKELRRQIDELDNNIDMVVISHLHKDHVSALPYLLRTKKVDKIFLPYFDTRTYEDVFVAYLISNQIYPGSELFELTMALYGNQYNGKIITYDLPQSVCIHKNNLLDIKINNWTFNFYNRQISDSIVKNIKQRLNILTNGSNICDWYDNNGSITPIRVIFTEELRHKHNLSSLVLIHYPQMGVKTVLTGDVHSDEELNGRIESHIADNDSIVLQIPHHGAKEAYDLFSEKCKQNAKVFVISFGEGNRYRHPSKTTIQILQQYSGITCNATCTSSFEYCYSKI